MRNCAEVKLSHNVQEAHKNTYKLISWGLLFLVECRQGNKGSVLNVIIGSTFNSSH